MRCKDCKYYYVRETNAWSGKARIIKDGKCSNPLMVDDEKNDECPINGVYAKGGDEDGGDLIVGEDFGCIHFEQKQS